MILEFGLQVKDQTPKLSEKIRLLYLTLKYKTILQ